VVSKPRLTPNEQAKAYVAELLGDGEMRSPDGRPLFHYFACRWMRGSGVRIEELPDTERHELNRLAHYVAETASLWLNNKGRGQVLVTDEFLRLVELSARYDHARLRIVQEEEEGEGVSRG
jgi:hypothetical protein